MATATLARLVPATAHALGALRALLYGFFLLSILLTDFDALARLPPTVVRPTGAMQLLPWEFYERLLTPRGMLALKTLLVLTLLASAAGYLTRFSTKGAAALVLFYEGLLRSFGHFNHDEMLAVYGLVVLAFAPCGDAFSVDSLPDAGATRRGGPVKYGYPVLLLRALVGWAYFSAALIKLRVAGFGYFGPETLPALAVRHSLDNLHDTRFTLALRLAEYRGPLTTAAVALVVAWELLFPLALFSRRARRPLLAFGVVFHVATVFLLNVFFPFHLLMYAAFVDWHALARRLTDKSSTLARVANRWREFRGAPESPAAARAEPGDTFLSALLASEALRPLAWLGRRLAARRRG